MADSQQNEYLPPANVTMTPEAIVARVRELEKLREEAHFEAVFHAFSDEDSCRIAVDWRNELDEGLEAWGKVAAKATAAPGKSVRTKGDQQAGGGSPWPVRWWEALVRMGRAARRRGEAELRKHRRK